MITNATEKRKGIGVSRLSLDMTGGGIPIPTAQAQWSFKVSIRGSKINVADGYRCVVDFPWGDPVVTTPITYTSGQGGVVYMVRYYPTATDGVPNDDGYWSDVLYGTPPENSTLLHVFRIASISASGVVKHEHFGNISVVDRVDC